MSIPMNDALPIPARLVLAKLGNDIRKARLRRRMRAETLAARARMSRTTLHKIERGNAGVSMGKYLAVLWVLDLHGGVGDLADRSRDRLGLDVLDEQLPQRVRVPENRPEGQEPVAGTRADHAGSTTAR